MTKWCLQKTTGMLKEKSWMKVLNPLYNGGDKNKKILNGTQTKSRETCIEINKNIRKLQVHN